MKESELQDMVNNHLIGYAENRKVLLFHKETFWVIGILDEEETLQTTLTQWEPNYFEKLKANNVLELTEHFIALNLKSKKKNENE